ncbi:MAG TPA: hypothetical protein VK116_00690, partial [Planctomycetota bacterium]|nr:hypothetical protein [Planctomycetota bacterium]
MRGGEVEPGFEVEISSSQGIVYYTLDGSDPREVGGAPNPAARIAGGTAREKLLDANASARAWVPESGALGSAWIDPDFDDSTWIEGATGVGFERATGYEDLIGLDLIDAMDGKSASAYIRIPFDVDAATLASIERAILAMKYDDGFVAYLGGVEIARRNAPAPLAWDSQATMPNTDASAVVFEEIPLASTEHLRAGRNVLAIHGLNSSPTSNDFLILPEILIETDESDGQGIVLDETTLVRARARDGDEWSALAEAVYSIDPGLRITEIHYHPPAPLGESPFGADEFEFIEIQNVSDRTLLLDGWRFVEGIEFDFSESSIAELEPGGVIVLVENLVAFETRYDATTIAIAGEYSGRLANSGETLRIVGRYGEVVIEVAYDDSWKETDGGGYSLEPVDLGAPRNVFVDPASWRAGAALFGTPGFVEGAEPSGGRQIPGDLNQ